MCVLCNNLRLWPENMTQSWVVSSRQHIGGESLNETRPNSQTDLRTENTQALIIKTIRLCLLLILVTMWHFTDCLLSSSDMQVYILLKATFTQQQNKTVRLFLNFKIAKNALAFSWSLARLPWKNKLGRTRLYEIWDVLCSCCLTDSPRRL